MKVLVTGASGFIGGHLCRALVADGVEVVRAVRHPLEACTAVGNIDGLTDWSSSLQGVTAVVHLAGRAHVLHETAADPLAEFRKVNVDGTLNLARQAAQAGVRRFVFISSIGVHGLFSKDRAFSVTDNPNPHNEYAQSKYEAEQGLKLISAETGMNVTIIRPPLVYGPGVEANFLRIIKMASVKIPLPLGSVCTRRSLVFVGNLCDLILWSLTHPAAEGQTFLVSDDHDVSTSELLRLLANAMHKKIRLIPVPLPLLNLAGRLTGCSGEISRLCGSLQVDISHTKEVLGWNPPVSLEEGIRQTVESYLASRQNARRV